MTANERIEGLLNLCGQTIADLPDEYDAGRTELASFTAMDWYKDKDGKYARAQAQYICHLADVIDRMELALNKALYVLAITAPRNRKEHRHGRQ